MLEVGNEKISKEQFERVYLKNNVDKEITAKDIDNYLDLYINFRLKVLEAEDLGYDTTKSFKQEYQKYLSELAEPYFLDTTLNNKLLKEAYERTKKEVRLKYILFVVKDNDTLSAHKRALEAYKKIKQGESFDKVLQEMSDERNKKIDDGDAWYNGVFMMPYNLENFAYRGKIGDVSKPLYANNAYFILKIVGYRTAPKKIRVSHIYVRLPRHYEKEDSLKAMKLLDSISRALKSGMKFSEVAKKYSQDKMSGAKGGDLGWFSTGQLFHTIEEAAYSIKKIGDWTGPVRSAAGYHYVQLTGRKKWGSFAQERKYLQKKLEKSDRYRIVKENIYNKLKKKYSYKLEGNLKDFYTKINSKILNSTWNEDSIFRGDNRILASFGNKKLTYEEFAKYIFTHQNRNKRFSTVKQAVDSYYDSFIKEALKSYQMTKLPQENKDYKYLMQEYHDGLLLFDITNDKVWNKAVEDSVGLRKYYESHRNKYYEKLNLAIYSYDNKKTLRKALKILRKKEKKRLTDTMVVIMLNKKGERHLNLVKDGIFGARDNKEAQLVVEEMKDNKIKNTDRVIVDKKDKEIIYIKDNFDLIKGLVTADYQNELEDEWVKELRKKYKYKVNKEIYKEAKKELLETKKRKK
jgi:peptidyl-prolyl cis-trans isomerase SurA